MPAVHDIVGTSTRPGRWEVVKVNKTTIELKPLDGQSNRNLRTYPYMITDAPPAPTPGQVGVAMSVDLPEWFDAGQVVTCIIPKLAGRLLVVTNDRGKERVACAPLFGAAGEYGWNIPRPTLTRLTRAEVASALLLDAYPHAVGGDEQSAISTVRAMLDERAEQINGATK